LKLPSNILFEWIQRLKFFSAGKLASQTIICLLFGSSLSGKSTLCGHLRESLKDSSAYLATDQISFSCNRIRESFDFDRFIIVNFLIFL
jgi:GTPase SAR1 family protein